MGGVFFGSVVILADEQFCRVAVRGDKITPTDEKGAFINCNRNRFNSHLQNFGSGRASAVKDQADEGGADDDKDRVDAGEGEQGE